MPHGGTSFSQFRGTSYWLIIVTTCLLCGLFSGTTSKANALPESVSSRAPLGARLFQTSSAGVFDEDCKSTQVTQEVKRQVKGDPRPQLYPYLPAVFAFGDSDFDTGNNLYLNLTAYKVTAFPPYGKSYHGIKGRYSDGRLIPDFLAQGLGLPLMPPYFDPDASHFTGASFAVAGSGMLNSTKNHYNPAVQAHLLAQVDYFFDFQRAAASYSQSYRASVAEPPLYPAPASFPKALYTLLLGANDILKFRQVQNGTLGVQSDALVEDIVSTAQTFVESIYAAGGRNFVIFNLGDVGCVPLARQLSNGSCSSIVSSIAANLATSTAQLPARLKSTAPEATVLIVDTFAFFKAVESNPPRFGVTNTADACCGGGVPGLGNTFTTCAAVKPATVNGVTYPKTVCRDPSAYQHWDQFHMTETMNQQLSRDVLGGATWVSPTNVLRAFVVPQIEDSYASLP